MATYRIDPTFIGDVVERRQRRKLRAQYTSAADLHAHLTHLGVCARPGKAVSPDTCENLMSGQRPGFYLFMQMIGAGLWPMWEWIMDPIIQAGGEAALEAELNQKKLEVRRHEMELEALRKARADGVSDQRAGGGQHNSSRRVGNLQGRLRNGEMGSRKAGRDGEE